MFISSQFSIGNLKSLPVIVESTSDDSIGWEIKSARKRMRNMWNLTHENGRYKPICLESWKLEYGNFNAGIENLLFKKKSTYKNSSKFLKFPLEWNVLSRRKGINKCFNLFMCTSTIFKTPFACCCIVRDSHRDKNPAIRVLNYQKSIEI